MKKILVTGAKGYLGTHLVSRLKESGYDVRQFARPHPDTPQSELDDPDTVWGDVRDIEAVERAVNGVDKVIHTISNFRHGGSDKDEAYAINVEGTENVLNACLKYKVKRLVHCSTIGVHGDVKEVPARETTPFNPCDLYQETKLTAEQKVWEFSKNTGLAVAVVRPISMFGPGDRRMLKLFKMIKLGRFMKIGPCDAFFQPAYVDDVVDGFMLCLENEAAIGEAFFIGGNEYVKLEELLNMIASELNVSAPKIRLPLWPVLKLIETELDSNNPGARVPARPSVHLWVYHPRYIGAGSAFSSIIGPFPPRKPRRYWAIRRRLRSDQHYAKQLHGMRKKVGFEVPAYTFHYEKNRFKDFLNQSNLS